MKEILDKIFNEYENARKQTFAGHPFGVFYRNEIPQKIYNTNIVSSDKYLVTGSVGLGGWADSFWFAIFNRNITTSARKGVYIVYLLSKDGNSLYLTLNQGCEDIRKTHTKKETISIMREKASKIINKVPARQFTAGNDFSLGESITERAELYQKGAIFFKEYQKGINYTRDSLLQDLKDMVGIYEDYCASFEMEDSRQDEDIIRFKKILEIFVKQLKINNDLLPGEKIYGQGYRDMPKIQNIYKDVRVYNGFILELALQAGFHSFDSSNYVHLRNSWVNIVPVFVQTKDNKHDVAALQVVNKPNNRAVTNYQQKTIEVLGLFDGKEPNDELKALFNDFKKEIQNFQSCENKSGKFDSWEIVDNFTAIKTCDKSFFEHKSTGVPKEICWFFDAEALNIGESKLITLLIEGNEYSAKVSNDTTDRRRIRISWGTELSKLFAPYNNKNAKATFVKLDGDIYEINIEAALTTKEDLYDSELFYKALSAYKEEIKQGWLKNELYKWEAVKHFKDNWDIDAVDFKEMWVTAAGKTFNLLGNVNNFPRRMISEFAQADKEAVRQMFRDLFDENKEVTVRIDAFKSTSDDLRAIYGEKEWGSHFQTANAITTYLWLRYPDKYYIYKYTDCKNAAEKIGCNLPLKKGDNEGVVNIFKLFDEISEALKNDVEMQEIKNTYLNSNCYNDPMFRTFAIDFLYFVSRKYKNIEELEGGEIEMSMKEKIEHIKAYIAAKGFNYEGQLIENFYLSLKSKPFVILAGTSGTGKTKLVKLFAEAIGAEMKLVPVRPDWSDSSDLFGHVDLAGNFKAGAIIDFVKQAELDKNKPYFLCLDEMNLARVEYYLSDFLSIIETRDRVNGEIITDPLISEEYYQNERAKDKYGKLIIPENLYIIGTVNMDETTFPFSKKVLDRANTIEFSFVNFMPKEQVGLSASALQLDNSFLKTNYLYFNEIEDEDFKSNICFKLEELNKVLRKANLHVGYRVRDEISFYMINNQECELLEENVAFDNEIMQKILPRIQGSSGAIKQLLCDLFVLCAGDYAGFTGSSVHEQMSSYVSIKECKYPNTAKKIVFMMRRYEEDGFTSYWL